MSHIYTSYCGILTLQGIPHGSVSHVATTANAAERLLLSKPAFILDAGGHFSERSRVLLRRLHCTIANCFGSRVLDARLPVLAS